MNTDAVQALHVFRLHALAQECRRAATLEALVDAVGGAAQALTAADGVTISAIDPKRSVVQTLFSQGMRAEPPARPSPAPDGVPYFQELTRSGRRVVIGVEGRNGPPSPVLDPLGRRWASSHPIVVDERVWGALFLTRLGDRPMSAIELDTADVMAELLSAGVARLHQNGLLERLAYQDPLTGLGNRRMIEDRLRQLLERPEPFGPLSVVLCDVNGLKTVNDTLGHAAGDHLLRQVGGVLAAAAARLERAWAARLGGDEYVLVIDGLHHEQLRTQVRQIAEDAGRLELGAGLALGAVTATHRPPTHETAASAVAAMLRMADAEQYRDKLRIRRQPPPPTPSSLPMAAASPELLARLVRDASQLLAHHRHADVPDRLASIGDLTCGYLDAAAWWLQTERDGLLREVACGAGPRAALADGTRPVAVDPTPYRLADFPESRRAMGGASFYAAAQEGEAAERLFLASTGFACVVAAGGTDQAERRWLLRIYGDVANHSLQPLRPVLAALTQLAIG